MYSVTFKSLERNNIQAAVELCVCVCVCVCVPRKILHLGSKHIVCVWRYVRVTCLCVEVCV